MNILLIGGLLFAAYAMAWPQICPMIGMQGCPTTSLFQDLMANMGGMGGAAPPVEEAPPAEGEGAEGEMPAEGEGGEGGEGEYEEGGGEGEYGEGEGGESYYVRAYPGYARISVY